MNRSLDNMRQYARSGEWVDTQVDNRPLRVHPLLWERYPQECQKVFRKFMIYVEEQDLKPVTDPVSLKTMATVDSGIDFIDGHKVVAFLTQFTDTETGEAKKGACLDTWERCVSLGIISESNFITSDAPHRHKGNKI